MRIDEELKLKYPMKVVCAWCNKFMHWSKCVDRDETSHGLCENCLEKGEHLK